MATKHRIAVVCEGQTIDGWISYSIDHSMIEPAGAFMLRRPFSEDAWRILRRDARITVTIDGTRVITGPIDRRRMREREDIFEISGQCFVGRLVKESAPSMSYENMKMIEAIRRLSLPFFGKVTTSDARNRNLRRGNGRKVPSGKEPLVVDIPVPRRGRVHPGMARWAVIEQIVSQAGYIAWGSADGTEIFVGRPNYSQAAQFLFCSAKPGSRNRTTVHDIEINEDNGDRYSMIVVAGAGSGDLANYGNNVTSRSARVLDSDEAVDGTGRDFIYPKRMLMPERDFESNGDAFDVAFMEQLRRDFRRTVVTVTMKDHGQLIGTMAPTIYATNTIARVIHERTDTDEPMLIFSVKFEGDRSGGQTTTLELVPSGTEIVL